jgi:hypothetical protein
MVNNSTPSSFGKFDTNNVWQPKAFSGGSYGTNGFRLPFSDNSTAAALGTDTSSNGNTWTVNNILNGSGTVSENRGAGITSDPFSQAYGWYTRSGSVQTSITSNPADVRQVVIRWAGVTVFNGNSYRSSPVTIGGYTYTALGRVGSAYGWSGDYCNCFSIRSVLLRYGRFPRRHPDFLRRR